MIGFNKHWFLLLSERKKQNTSYKRKKKEGEKQERKQHLWATNLLIVHTLSGPPEHSPLMAPASWGLRRLIKVWSPRTSPPLRTIALML